MTLNADAYARIEQAATAAGESVAAYVTKAAEARRRNEVAEATARYCAQPQIAEQIAEWTAVTADDAHAVWARLGADA